MTDAEEYRTPMKPIFHSTKQNDIDYWTRLERKAVDDENYKKAWLYLVAICVLTKSDDSNHGYWACPKCGKNVNSYSYCPECGQAIDRQEIIAKETAEWDKFMQMRQEIENEPSTTQGSGPTE